VRWAPCPDACASRSPPRSRRRALAAAPRALRWGAAGWASASRHVSVRSNLHYRSDQVVNVRPDYCMSTVPVRSSTVSVILSLQCQLVKSPLSVRSSLQCRSDQAYTVGQIKSTIPDRSSLHCTLLIRLSLQCW
jgi:hypothetical protein